MIPSVLSLLDDYRWNLYACRVWVRFYRRRGFSPVICWNDSLSAFAVGWLQMDVNTLVKRWVRFHRWRSFLAGYLLEWLLLGVRCWMTTDGIYALVKRGWGFTRDEFSPVICQDDPFSIIAHTSIWLHVQFVCFAKRGRGFACYLTRRFSSACLYIDCWRWNLYSYDLGWGFTVGEFSPES